MGVVLKLFLVVFVVIVAYGVNEYMKPPPAPPKLEDVWWGSRDPAKEDTSIKPFKITFSDEAIKDLQQRLANTRPLTTPLKDIQHQYGLNTNLLKKFIDFWRTKYNFKEQEKFLNKFPQFKVSVQGLQIHYLHVKPKNPGNLKVLPLLLLHGWPGSVREFYEMIPLLTTPREGFDFVFEVYAPSLPGYGFSEGTTKPGLGAIEMAVVFKNFMKRLGHEKYYIHGGDWGGVIVQHMAALYPEHILGVHSNVCSAMTPLANLKTFLGSYIPSLIVDKEHGHLMYPLGEKFSFLMVESGYLHIQATKPDTVGVGLNDSPAGLAAYILEKFIAWTNADSVNSEDGKLEQKYSYTKLLDNIMIYWISQSITTSVRLYAETFNSAQFSLGVERLPINVPAACAKFPHELMYQPDSLLKERYLKLVHSVDYNDGGHFAAFELPTVVAKDIFDGISKMFTMTNKK